MEPFIYDPKRGLFWIEPWKEQFSNLLGGFTSRKIDSDRHFGNLAYHIGDDPENVHRNRECLSQLVEVPLQGMTCALQPHSNQIAVITEELRGAGSINLESSIKNVDGLVTNLTDTLLTLFFADCVPLFFFDPKKEVIGIAHAGWRGTVQNIAVEVVQTLQRTYGCKNDNIHVVIGPSIGSCCYQVDETVMTHVREVLPEESNLVAKMDQNNRYMLDLRKMNQILLTKEGILSQNIELTQLCTSCNTQLFFSHRKEKGVTGRMAGFVVLKGAKS